MLPYVLYLPDAIAKRILERTPNYCTDIHRETDRLGWWNHCDHCGAQIDDEELHHIDGPFSRAALERQTSVEVHYVREPFSALAGSVLQVLAALDD